MDRASKARYYRALIGATLEVETVTRLKQADGSSTELTNLRRMVAKSFGRKGSRSIIKLADIDREALKLQFPFETFTVADWPELFEGHVNRRIPQGVGTVMKMPLTWITKSGGTWKYAGPKLRPGQTATLLTVYRGTQQDNGAIVAASEYAASNGTTVPHAVGASTGITVATVNFTREQIGFDGQPYELTADWQLSGSRAPADEIAFILAAYGVTTDATTFNAASTYDNANGFQIDALYGGDTNGKTGNAIVEDLLRVARAWMIQTSTAAWALIQDVPKASSLQVDTSTDRVSIDEWEDPDTINKTITVLYRPKASNDENYTGKLQGTTTGSSGERVLSFPYVRDHVVADRLRCFYTKRETLRRGSGFITGAQTNAGDVITANDTNTLLGTADLLITAVSRPADRNDWKFREYSADLYVYTAGTLPADATTGYSPDFSFTPPLAPTSPTLVSLGASVSDDGTMQSWALIRAVPPAANWSRLMVQCSNTATGEIYQAQLRDNGSGQYEARVSGMRPNQAHTGFIWAVNANNIDGATAAIPGGFTTATFSTSPLTPTGLSVVSQGTVTDINGVVRAYALIRAVPPALYSRRLMAQVKDINTGAVQQRQLVLNGGNYEARFDNLLPNRPHEAIAWAVNFENTDGGVTSPASFTSATNTNVPTAPSSAVIAQKQSAEVVYLWGQSVIGSGAALDYYQVERDGGSGYNVATKTKDLQYVDTSVSIGQTYTMRVKARDVLGNESAYTTSSPYTVQRMIDDNYIIPAGVGTSSLANSSVTNPIIASAAVGASKANWAYTINQFTLPAGSTFGFGQPGVGFFPNVHHQLGNSMVGVTIVGAPSSSVCMGGRNDSGGSLAARIEEPVLL